MRYKLTDLEMICRRAVAHYGTDNQIEKCYEELGELRSELIPAITGNHDSIDRIKAIDEIADVCIMVNQMMIIFGESEVSQVIQYKLNRLMDRILRDDTLVED